MSGTLCGWLEEANPAAPPSRPPPEKAHPSGPFAPWLQILLKAWLRWLTGCLAAWLSSCLAGTLAGCLAAKRQETRSGQEARSKRPCKREASSD